MGPVPPGSISPQCVSAGRRVPVLRMPKRIESAVPTGARSGPLPKSLAPQLATLVKQPPSSDAWLHELKFDGYRMLCRIHHGKVHYWSRNRKDWTSKIPGLTATATALTAESAVIDGEVVILDQDGRSNFQKLQNAVAKEGAVSVCFQVFDLIYLNGFDLPLVALEERKSLLRELFKSLPAKSSFRYSDHVEGNGLLFFEHACKTGVEG